MPSGTILIGSTIEGKAAADWPLMYKLCEQYHRFGIEIFDLDTREISEQQRKWLHCDNGPIRRVMKSEKMTFMDAKVFLKVRFGRSFFVKLITADNCNKIEGTPYFECLTCHEIIHVAKLNYEKGERCCPECGSIELQLIAVGSSEAVSIKIINMWFDEIFSKIPGLEEPDPKWKEKKINRDKRGGSSGRTNLNGA